MGAGLRLNICITSSKQSLKGTTPVYNIPLLLKQQKEQAIEQRYVYESTVTTYYAIFL